MNKTIICTAMLLASGAATAQETYESAQLASTNLNGTARYIGMGGAMEALGADISTMSSNPAGIGLFRKSWVGASGGLTVQRGSADNGPVTLSDYDGKKGVTNADFNQIGFVYSTQTGSQTWFNLGVNYHKSTNFNMLSDAVNVLNNASLNKMSYMRLASQKINVDSWNKGRDDRWYDMSLMDDVNYSVINDNFADYGAGNDCFDGYSAADSYFARKDNSGYISQFDINFSGNLFNRIYLGVSFGLKDVHYNSYTTYNESLVDAADAPRGSVYTYDNRKITGTGFDIKFGMIFRPIEDSPFRIGAYIHTPTWYDLDCYGSMGAEAYYSLDNKEYSPAYSQTYDYKYKMTTPWKFGLSVGHTVDNIVALGATYEYADYSFIKNKIVLDYDHSVYEKDFDMDNNTDMNLRGVHTAKFGVEVKPVQEVAIRMGYNYISPMYRDNASKDFMIYTNPNDGSVGNYYTTYDYTNWKDTHRVTFGLGFSLSKNLNLDLSYQYSTQKGEYHPFQSVYDLKTFGLENGQVAEIASETNIGTPTTIKNNRHQINATLGYRF
ncbi:MAG: hemin receptor [Prevotellaceae bacterium]|nr:hemin receptor [Prevotellaceae bacterium]